MFAIWDISGSRQVYEPPRPEHRRVEGLRGGAGIRPVDATDHQKRGAAYSKNPYERARQARPAYPPRRLLAASELMSREVITIGSDAPLQTAWRLFKMHRFRHIPVVDEGRIVGMLSDRDLYRALAPPELPSTWADEQRSVGDIMSTGVISAHPDTSIRLVADIMFTGRFGAMPIVDPRDQLVGIVTRSDVLRALVRDAPLEIWG